MQPAVSRKPPWWLWPTILSLDAPAVALLWQAVVATSASVRLGSPERFVLGASVWLAYAADRWIEAFRLEPDRIQTHRHRFYLRWRWGIFAVWVAVLAGDVAVSFHGLAFVELRNGALLLCAVAVYLLSHQLVHRASRWRAPKEACVALLLTAGADVFIAGRAGSHGAATLVPLILFALLCFSNCALISLWENEVDRSHGQTSLALQLGRSARLGRALPWCVALLALGALTTVSRSGAIAAACAAASGVLLGLVDLAETRMGRIAARVLADVALMTPALPLLLGHLE